uniref:Uncharacterized protein n=1 Tax=Anguilla anguilla TaxID=7936 RepID=A0A0E9UHD5_ANGAN
MFSAQHPHFHKRGTMLINSTLMVIKDKHRDKYLFVTLREYCIKPGFRQCAPSQPTL